MVANAVCAGMPTSALIAPMTIACPHQTPCWSDTAAYAQPATHLEDNGGKRGLRWNADQRIDRADDNRLAQSRLRGVLLRQLRDAWPQAPVVVLYDGCCCGDVGGGLPC